jgi:hypothetical protein
MSSKVQIYKYHFLLHNAHNPVQKTTIFLFTRAPKRDVQTVIGCRVKCQAAANTLFWLV